MIRCCIIDKRTSTVVNVIEYPAVPEGQVPGFDDNFIAVPNATASIGWKMVGQTFVDPNPPPPPLPIPTVDEIYDQVLRDQRVVKAIVMAINDGTLIVGGNKTGAQLKSIIKAKM